MKYIRTPYARALKFFNSMDDQIKVYDRATGKEMDINPEGSLGLLALGDIAVKPWREVRVKTGYEKELLERVAKFREEVEKKKEEMKRKREEKQKEKEKEQQEQQKDEQKDS